MYRIRTIAIGMIIGSLFAWHDAQYEHITSQPGFPAVIQWVIMLAVFWGMGLIMASLIWPTVERIIEMFVYSFAPNLFPDRRIALITDGQDPNTNSVWTPERLAQRPQKQESSEHKPSPSPKKPDEDHT